MLSCVARASHCAAERKVVGSTKFRRFRVYRSTNVLPSDNALQSFNSKKRPFCYYFHISDRLYPAFGWLSPNPLPCSWLLVRGSTSFKIFWINRLPPTLEALGMRIRTLLLILPACLVTAVPSSPVVQHWPGHTPLALKMLDSIIARDQGVSINASVKTSTIEAGLLLMGIDTVLENSLLSRALRAKYESYLDLIMSGLIPALMNITADATSPLDEFSIGTQFIKQ